MIILCLEIKYYSLKQKITPICLDSKITPIRVLYIPDWTKTHHMAFRTPFQPPLPLPSPPHGMWWKCRLKRIALYKPRPNFKQNEGMFTPMFPTVLRYFAYRVLPMCMPSTRRLLICVYSVVQSPTLDQIYLVTLNKYSKTWNIKASENLLVPSKVSSGERKVGHWDHFPLYHPWRIFAITNRK